MAHPASNVVHLRSFDETRADAADILSSLKPAGRASLYELSQWHGLSPKRLVGAVDRLHRLGLATLHDRPDGNEHRRLVSITSAGLTYLVEEQKGGP